MGNNMNTAFLGGEISVGDIVIYMATHVKRLDKGVVVKVNKQKFTIQGNHGGAEQRDHKLVYKIGVGEVKEFAKFQIWSDTGLYQYDTMILPDTLDEHDAHNLICNEMKVWRDVIRVVKVSM